MLSIRASESTTPSETFVESKRRKGENNSKWIERHLESSDNAAVTLLLVGGTDATSLRLRMAQAHVRHTMDPSHWSHVALLLPDDSPDKCELIEISLQPARGFGFPAPTNGVQRAQFQQYSNPRQFPNICLIRFPGTDTQASDVQKAIKQFQRQRNVLDATELIVMWLAFAWGVGKTPNPLLEGYGIPSAAMVEVLCSSSDFDLTPGLDSRGSCPEAIWQSAKWWHDYYQKTGPNGLGATAPYGAYDVGHRLDFPEQPRMGEPVAAGAK